MELNKIIPEIPSTRNYWLVRTQGGEFFKEFYFEDYVAIGWNEITDTNLMVEERREDLINAVKLHFTEKQKPGGIASLLIKFNEEMKKGDIVIIPDSSSNYIAFGELLEDDIYLEDNIENNEEDEFDETDINEETKCPYIKRRRVKWLKKQAKKDIDIYLYKILNSHHTISRVKEEYKNIVDRSLYPYYIKDGQAHLVLRVKQEKNISLVQLSKLLSNNLDIIDEFNDITESNISKDDIDIKLNINSAGPVEIISNPSTILLIGVVLTFLVGGTFKFKHSKDGETECEIGSEGMIEKIGKFIQNIGQNNKLNEKVNETVKELKVEIPVFHVNDEE
nr:hypothetical protein [uncultured Cellulosilyticum sp.]